MSDILSFLLSDPAPVPPLDVGQVSQTRPPLLNPRENITAAANTAKVLSVLEGNNQAGAEIEEDAEAQARSLFTDGRDPTPSELNDPGIMLKLDALLTLYDKEIVEDANQIRRYVTNRLIEDSNDKSVHARLKALGMLGNITDVGLFTERRELVVSDKSADELDDMLREKFENMVVAEQ